MRVAIIGAGLAGTACAYTLKKAGLEPIIYEASNDIATGASGNPAGLINPRFSAFRTTESDYFTSAYAAAVSEFDLICHSEASKTLKNLDPSGIRLQDDNPIDWTPCGALHLMLDEKKERRFPQTLENWSWPEEYMQIMGADEASNIAGIQIEYDCLYLPHAGWVNPQKLCQTYTEGCDVHLGVHIEDLKDLEADAIILACGIGALKFEEARDLPLKQVRGQVTQIKATKDSAQIKCNLCFGGYMTPAHNGEHMLGATFQRWLDHSEIVEEDDEENIVKMQEALPILDQDFDVTGHRAALRTTSPNHFPIVGTLPGQKNIYMSLAHGSHGIISSLIASKLLLDIILGQPLSQSQFTAHALSPARFME